VNSIVREAVLPGEKISLIDHISAYFIDVDRSVLSPDPELAPILEENAIWLGPGHQVVATNLFLSNRYTMTMAMDELLGVEGEWARQGDLSDAVEKFKNFHPLVTKVLNYVKSDQCLIWRFPELPLLDSWVSESGKVVIVGDAAHAMLPFAAQGAAMGIEDSACLAECLSRAASTSDIPKLLGIFQKIRQPRVESVAGRSRAMHKMSHMSDGPAQEARDKHLKSRPYYSPPSKWDRKPIDVAPPGMDPMYEPYLVGHDVFEFVCALFRIFQTELLKY
jgi:salicylate hydroxylase